ncbi:unnamed protein product [Brachionus calyciflorus]|uniref:MULE transposase domain-containing protein n=1 Tax=Brachionus calyciflorus TaxID=104777 RepID=A0A814JPJ1_9BILA|nr:unnamed protein product [Brachionus calyciflorus]
MSSTRSFVISFPYTEWLEHLSSIKENLVRKRLLVDFHDNLSYKLPNTYNIKCWLVNTYNWFNNKLFWTAKYKCKHDECNGIFTCFIKKEPNVNEDVLVFVQFNGDCIHEKIGKIPRCSGVKRDNLAIKLIADGISNVLDENVVYNYENSYSEDFFKARETNLNVLKIIKSEKKKQFRLNSDYLTDIKASLNLFRKICLAGKQLTGYVQEITEYPFGFILFNDIQVKFWLKIQRVNPVWYLDATGCVIRDIPNQQKPFLFSLVMHDPQTETIIPFFDFVSTSHNSMTISKYFFSLKKYLEINIPNGFLQFPKVIIMDFSWAFINSCLETFNLCSISQYLSWSFEYFNNDVKEAYNRLEKAVMSRKLIIDEIEKEGHNDFLNTEKILNEKDNFEHSGTPVRQLSPFDSYFKVLLSNLSYKEDSKELNANYQPELFSIIETYLYLMPLWTGVMIHCEELNFVTRLSNNQVENWFNHLKNNMLKEEKVMPSEFAGLVYQRILAKYILYYKEKSSELINQKSTTASIYEEEWSKDNKKKRQKGYYFKETVDFGSQKTANYLKSKNFFN